MPKAHPNAHCSHPYQWDFITLTIVSEVIVTVATIMEQQLPSDTKSKAGHTVAGSAANDELHVSWLVTDTARLMRTVFDRRAKVLGLTRPQWLAIVSLHRRPGASQSELADMMEIEKAPAGRIVDRMEEKGLVERRPDPGDRRINRIYLTARGEQIFEAIYPLSVQTVRDALTDLSLKDRDQLAHLLTRIKSTLVAIAESDLQPEDSWPDIDDVAADQETRAI